MDIRFADKNDRKAIWTWIYDNHFKFLNVELVDLKYRDHINWFENLLANKSIAILTDDNLRVGFSFIQMNKENILEIKFFLKPIYWSTFNEKIIVKSCDFFYEIFRKDIVIYLPKDFLLRKELLKNGFAEFDKKFIVKKNEYTNTRTSE